MKKTLVLLCAISLIFSCTNEELNETQVIEDSISAREIFMGNNLKRVDKLIYGHVVEGDWGGYDCEGMGGICAWVTTFETTGEGNIMEIDLGFQNEVNVKAKYLDLPLNGITSLEIFENTSMSEGFIEDMGLSQAVIVPGVYPIEVTEESPLGELLFEVMVE